MNRVDMGVDETGENELSTRVNHLRRPTYEQPNEIGVKKELRVCGAITGDRESSKEESKEGRTNVFLRHLCFPNENYRSLLIDYHRFGPSENIRSLRGKGESKGGERGGTWNLGLASL